MAERLCRTTLRANYAKIDRPVSPASQMIKCRSRIVACTALPAGSLDNLGKLLFRNERLAEGVAASQ